MGNGRIKSVKVRKLWGVKNISTGFNQHVNIFIGVNGSSKTTFLNLIEASLLCDINIFLSVDFESIEIILYSQDGVESTINVSKVLADNSIFIKYVFDGAKEYVIPCIDTNVRAYRPVKFRENYILIQKELGSLVKASWLSVNRDNQLNVEYDRGRDPIDRLRNTVDLKLEELSKKLIVYQLQLEYEANKSANKFKEDALSLMLYDEQVDVYKKEELTRVLTTDINLMRDDLYKAFNALGVVRKDKKNKIELHVEKVKEVLLKIESQRPIAIEDACVLPLINRTLSIIEISKKHEDKTDDIFQPINNFFSCLKGFMPKKQICLNEDNDGEIRILLREENNHQMSVGLTSFSSGEKQLFILLSEALLQRSTPYLFIADEPELSLHIEWQRKILRAVMDLNPNAQIIVATHSPEIAGSFPSCVINMSKITSYE